MLVLTRKVNEAIIVGNDVVVRVLEVKGTGPKASVKLGIEAPQGTKILREEIEREIAQEMSRAASSSKDIARLMRQVKEEAEKREKRENPLGKR
ncbi:MAG TPA: carbon storage regulator CsrA [Firmicutes bacterium]|nr:carbon storage regulator CsrA [Candidatus Fermentithermobacillaceae bacterium]